MIAPLPKLDELPRQSASQVKNKWRDVVREVHATGGVAVTNHSSVEMVLVDAATYERLAANAAVMKDREAAVLQELADQFDKRLSVLQQASAAKKAGAVFSSKGHLAKRPKAGGSY